MENLTPSKYLKSFFATGIKETDRKSIQTNFRFIVDFSEEKGIPKLQPWHILKVSFPISFGWDVENMKIGPYNYSSPKMDHSGFDIDITFEEDTYGTIAFLVHALQRKMIGEKGSDGTYASQSQNRINSITINIYDDLGELFMTVVFNKAYFVKCDSLTLDYDSSDSIKYNISFHSDLLDITYNKFEKYKGK